MKELLLCLIVAALVLCAAASSNASAKQPPVPYYGINHEFVWTPDKEIPGLIRAMKDANVQIVRVPIRWTMIEPEKGTWSFDKVDRVIHAIRSADIQILATFMSVPSWASGVDQKEAQARGFWDVYAPKDMSEWSEFVGRCVNRYKKDIRYWEIWNEENGPDFYKPMPDAGAYVQILKSAHDAIKGADPRAMVVLGGLQMNGIIPNPWLPIKIENFLQKIYDAGGRPYFDAANIHPYVVPTKDQGATYCAKLVRDTLAVMKKNGDGRKPLWITETGTYTGQGVTEEMQAEHLEGIYRELARIPQVKAVYWFTLRDYSQSICGGEDSMGMMSFDGRRKPCFETYKRLAASGKAQ